MTMVVASELTAVERAAVLALAGRAARADGVFPLNERALTGLDGVFPLNERAMTGLDGIVQHWLAWQGGRLEGYACVYDGAAQLVVDPLCRRRGVGSDLLAEARARELWSFGDLRCGRGFCSSHDFVPVRCLLVMAAETRSLAPPVDPPAGVRIKACSGDPTELEELVELNARVFHDHPEQGRWTMADFTARMASPWFDPAGLLIGRADDGRMVGFHWTKVESGEGEVYLIGVDSDWSGRGLGRALLDAGVAHLVDHGIEHVRLWVDGDNPAAMSLYEKSGFSFLSRDVRYRRQSDVHRDPQA